jgi:hypothetical protein
MKRRFHVQGTLSWTETRDEYIDTVVCAEDEEEAQAAAALEEWGVILGDDRQYQDASFYYADTYVEELNAAN